MKSYFLLCLLLLVSFVASHGKSKKSSKGEIDYYAEEKVNPDAVRLDVLLAPKEGLLKKGIVVKMGKVTCLLADVKVDLSKKESKKFKKVFGDISFKGLDLPLLKKVILGRLKSSLVRAKNVTFVLSQKEQSLLAKNLNAVGLIASYQPTVSDNIYVVDIELTAYAKKVSDKTKMNKGSYAYYPMEESVVVFLETRIKIHQQGDEKVLGESFHADHYAKYSVAKRGAWTRNPRRGVFTSLALKIKAGNAKESQMLFEKRASKFDTTPFPTRLLIYRVFADRALQVFENKFLAIERRTEVLYDKKGDKKAIALMKAGAFATAGAAVNVHTILDEIISSQSKKNRRWVANMYHKGLCYEALGKLKKAQKIYVKMSEAKKLSEVHKEAILRVKAALGVLK